MTISRDYLEVLPPHGDVWCAGAATADQIAALEAALQVALPASYRSFLATAGATAIGDTSVSGIIDGDPLSLDGGSLFGDTVLARNEQQLPLHLLVIQADGDAPHCIDTSEASDLGENPVICFEVFNSVSTRIAGSFDEWFSTFFVGRA